MRIEKNYQLEEIVLMYHQIRKTDIKKICAQVSSLERLHKFYYKGYKIKHKTLALFLGGLLKLQVKMTRQGVFC